MEFIAIILALASVAAAFAIIRFNDAASNDVSDKSNEKSMLNEMIDEHELIKKSRITGLEIVDVMEDAVDKGIAEDTYMTFHFTSFKHLTKTNIASLLAKRYVIKYSYVLPDNVTDIYISKTAEEPAIYKFSGSDKSEYVRASIFELFAHIDSLNNKAIA